MSVSSITGSPADLLRLREQSPARSSDAQSVATGKPSAAAAPAVVPPVSGGAPQPPAVPVAAPPGTDPALWSILTGEERAFFARTSASGPVTYFKIMSPNATTPAAAPSSRGRRINVLV